MRKKVRCTDILKKNFLRQVVILKLEKRGCVYMKCEICGRTNNECTIKKIKNKYLCPKHVTQWYRYGKFLTSTICDSNKYIIHDDYAEIILKDKNQNIVGYAQIDIDDVEKCKKYKWHMRKSRNTNYVITTINQKTKIHLHRFILNYTGTKDVDHLDHNGLNNRKINLEIKSHANNLRNQHGQRRGIRKTSSNKYCACITKNYKTFYLGTYDTYEEALAARLKAEKTCL